MKLFYADAEFPSRVISNHEILENVREHSGRTFKGELEQLIKSVDLLLDLSGARTRRCIASEDESNQLVARILEKTRAQIKKQGLWNKKGLVISASVDRVFSEPGDAYFYAHQLGLGSVECFDILDACNSHVRAWHLAKSLLSTKSYDWILVISAELRSGLEFIKGHFKERYSFKTKQELSWKFPALTLGDAVAVSLLADDHSRENKGPDEGTAIDWHFQVESKTSNAPLCYVSSAGARHFESSLGTLTANAPSDSASTNSILDGPLRFFCHYSELERESVESVVNVWKRFRRQLGDSRPTEKECLITHCSNGNGWAGAARWAGFPEHKHINLYSDFGNVVSCSVPASIGIGRARGILQNNDLINVWTGAAGSSYFAFQLPFQNWENL